MKQIPYNPKFKLGDIIQYRANKYRILNIPKWGNNWGYDVQLLSPIVDPEDRVVSIGSAGEQDMRLVEGSDIVLDAFEEKLYDIVQHYLLRNKYEVSLWDIRHFAEQLKSLVTK